MKYADSEFTISKSHARDLRNKPDIFKAKTRTRKTVFIVMITAHGVKENAYYEELVSQQLTADALFARSCE